MAESILATLAILIKSKGDTSGLEKTDRAIRKTNKNLQKTHGLLSSMANKFTRGFNLSFVRDKFMDYLQFEKDLGAMQSRFFAITQDEGKAKEEFEYIRKLAIDTANDIKSTADSYSIFYSATRKALGQEGARGVFEDWTRVGRVLHLTDYQFERVTYALREMASKGAIYAQDLRMQIGTHVPNAMELARKASEEMGITGTDWFEKLQKSAKGNAKVTTEFVKLFSKQARIMFGSEEAFRKAMQQPDALAKQISNKFQDFGIRFSQAGGNQMIISILKSVTKTLDSIDLNRLADNLGAIAKGIGTAFEYLPQIFSILKIILINVMIIAGAKGLASIVSFFRSTAIARFFIRSGLKPLFRLLFKESVTSLFKSGLLKGAIRAGVGAIPLWGQIAFILMTIFDVIMWFKSRFDNKAGLRSSLANYGTTPEQALNILRTVKANGVTSQEDLRRQIGFYKGGELLSYQAEYNDNGNISITINGVNYTIEDIEDVVENAMDKHKDKKPSNFFNRPNPKAPVFLR